MCADVVAIDTDLAADQCGAWMDGAVPVNGARVSASGVPASDPFRFDSPIPGADTDPVRGQVRRAPVRSIWNGSTLLVALVLGSGYVTWDAVAVFLVLGGITLCTGHSVGYRRRLVHLSFKCGSAVERAMVWMGAVVGMGGPPGTIRAHDLRDRAQRQSHCHDLLAHRHRLLRDGWWNLHRRLVLAHPPRFDAGLGIADDPFDRFLERTWNWHQAPIGLVLHAIGGIAWLVWGVFVRVAACTTMHWFISCFAHTRGPQSWPVDGAGVQARDVPIAAIPSMGESWRSNHHAFPALARHSPYPAYRFIQLLEWLGLAWAVQTPANLPPRTGVTPARPDAGAIVVGPLR
jgi:stearoyl-CoA desaturase (delta-9 desaturase)